MNAGSYVVGITTERDVSWFEALPAISLEMLEAAGMTPAARAAGSGGLVGSAFTAGRA